MTDCRIVTKDAARTSAAGKRVVRMAFVGFRTVAAGERAIRLFDGTFVGSQKIRVDAAQSLATQRDVKRRQDEEEAAAKAERRAAKEAAKRARGHGKSSGDDADAPPTAGGETKRGPMSEMDKLKASFVEQQVHGRDGPSWAGELLRPTAADGASAPQQPSASNAQATVEDEEAALKRQQELGDVGDDDFLAALTDETKRADVNAAAETEEKLINQADEDDDRAAANDAHVDDAAAESSRKKAKKPSLTPDQQIAMDSHRVRVANIPYAATSAEVKNFISSAVGDVQQVHLPVTKDTKQPKGIAFVTFASGDAALRGLDADGSIFMGRLLRVTAAPPDPYKLAQEAKRAAEAAAKEAAAASAKGGAGPAEDCKAAASTSFKAERLEKKKRSDGNLMWNPLFVESATAVSKVASSLGVGSDAIVSVEAGGAAVRAAVAEAHLTSEAAKVLGDEGINLGAMDGASLHRNRSNTTILVKHLPKGMNASQVAQLFAKHGQLEAVAAPSSGAFVLIAFVHEGDAKSAFSKLAYRMVGGSPLFLEWAPVGALNSTALDDARQAEIAEDEDVLGDLMAAARKQAAGGATARPMDDDDAGDEQAKPAQRDVDSDDDEAIEKGASSRKAKPDVSSIGDGAAHVDAATVYVTNLPFGINESSFVTFLEGACKKLVSRPQLVVRISLQETKGRAYLTVADASTATYVIAKIHGRSLEGRPIAAQLSHNQPRAAPRKEQPDVEDAPKAAAASASGAAKAPSAVDVAPGCNPLKVMVKNLPFEATEADLRQLFRSFSEVKAVRVPQKVHAHGGHHQNNHRGFGFVEFLTEQEAANAISMLRNTHLYGRHLVLEYAKL